MISQISARAVNSYLERNSLDGTVDLVLARDHTNPLAREADLIEYASTRLGATPGACALVTASASMLEAARQPRAWERGREASARTWTQSWTAR